MGRPITEAIKQAKFRNEAHKLAVNLVFTVNWLSGLHQHIFKKHGITAQQFNVLRILRGQYPNPATLHLIKDRMLDKMSDASRIVERMRKVGLVERLTCKQDRRAVDIRITPKGLDMLAEIDRETPLMDEAFVNLSEEEARQLNSLLDKLRID